MDNVLIVVEDIAAAKAFFMFAGEDLDDVLARLRTHGAELVGEVARYEDRYRLCFIRGPEGILLGLAEQLR
jgi:predicted enzyme related to lactoylglutathione lyase